MKKKPWLNQTQVRNIHLCCLLIIYDLFEYSKRD